MTYRFADREEVFGDAFYLPPGHFPVQNEPASSIFMPVVARNLRRRAATSTAARE